jgi:hypothetical protein
MEYPAIHEYTDDHRLIKLTIGQLLELPIENWKHNRPPDEVRVVEIKEFIQDKVKINDILQPFYIHYNSKKDIYEVLDGIHRYSAMKGAEEHISDKTVFVHLFVDLSCGSLVDIFENLNKTVPVPELYIGQPQADTTKKDIIEGVAEQWKKLYKSHFSGSSTSCQIPNIIRDHFINILSELYTSYRIRCKTKLLELLERANSNIKDYIIADVSCREIPIKFSDKQKQKCLDSGCYLFLYSRDIRIIKYFIENGVTSVTV